MEMQSNKKSRIVMILVNALVEWILISLLLLNSLFTYLITKYAHFFALNLKPNTTISHNHAAAAHCKDVIEEEEELDIVDGDNNDHELEEEANNEHQIVSDVYTFSFREEAPSEEEEDECLKEDTHMEEEDNEQDDSLQLIHIHCSTPSLRPVPLDLIDSLMFRGQITLTMDTPLHLEADGEFSQAKPLSYRDNGEQEAGENEAETPTSLDSLHNNTNKLLLLLSEKRDSYSSTSVEECLDGSIDRAVTVERLKSALTSERKTLRAVYSELEEERSASAIAANHTMAMITRLQEEKAAMQMEALQYQRMMEEQAEYDQEALQLLNQLMLNKEKEKDELAKELEMYRDNHNTLIEEDHIDDDDDNTQLSIDLNRAMIEKHSNDYMYDGSRICDDDDEDLEVMALDCMKHMSELDESLAEFEEEKLSILDQLKALEEKLLMMSGEGRVEDDVQKETMQSMAKQLLPLLDEAEDDESAEIEMNLVEDFSDDEEAKKVDRVYERLKALEEENANEEDKQGMNHLLREILQNLRDLKTVELQVQSTGIA